MTDKKEFQEELFSFPRSPFRDLLDAWEGQRQVAKDKVPLDYAPVPDEMLQRVQDLVEWEKYILAGRSEELDYMGAKDWTSY